MHDNQYNAMHVTYYMSTKLNYSIEYKINCQQIHHGLFLQFFPTIHVYQIFALSWLKTTAFLVVWRVTRKRMTWTSLPLCSNLG